MERKKAAATSRLIGSGLFVLIGGIFISCSIAAPGSGSSPEISAQQANAITAQREKVSDPQTVSDFAFQDTTNNFRAGGPLATFVTADFVGSSLCAVCHDLLVDLAGNDMSISNHWRSTMMANAAKDPFWQAKVSSEVSRNPALKEVIEGKCSLCHMPMAWVEAYNQGQARNILGNGFLNHSSKLHEAAMDGVSCSLCHQIQDIDLGGKESFSGKFTINTEIPRPDRKIFGPYKDVETKPMRTSVGYTPVYGPQTNDSALCATCHTLFTPFVDTNGRVVGEFPEQTAFLEWQHSDYGVSAKQRYDIGENKTTGLICQECHMPHSKAGGVKIAKWAPPEVKEQEHFSQHHFVGGNVFMLRVLQDTIPNLRLSASTSKLEATKQRTMSQLQGSSAQLSFLGTRKGGDELTATLRIDNRVGHKFPTGFPSRNLWVHLTVEDKNGRIVFESGRPRSDGRIAGNDADEQNQTYEPHYEMITSPEQVQIYETVMADIDGAVTYTILRAAKYLKDNRLLPRGFEKETASKDIAVHGKAAGDKNFIGGMDEITYKVKTKGFSGPFIVKAELLYNAISYNFMNDLQRDDHLSLVRRIGRYYKKTDKTPVLVASVQITAH